MQTKRKKLDYGMTLLPSLEEFVPKDHYLRRLDRVLDLSFVHQAVSDKYCQDNGRPSIDPQVGRYRQNDLLAIQLRNGWYTYALNNPLLYVDPMGLKEWILVNATVGGGFGVLALEAGQVFLFNPDNLNEWHRFSLVSGGVGFGFGGALQIEVGSFDGPEDPGTISDWSLTVSGFAVAGQGYSGQVTGTSFWGGDLGASSGIAGGAGFGVGGMVTRTFYHGIENFIDPRNLRLVKDYLKEHCRYTLSK